MEIVLLLDVIVVGLIRQILKQRNIAGRVGHLEKRKTSGFTQEGNFVNCIYMVSQHLKNGFPNIILVGVMTCNEGIGSRSHLKEINHIKEERKRENVICTITKTMSM